MEKALAIQKEVQRILGTEEVFLVGGSVRDIVMGDTPKDYDFCTPMLPEDIVDKVKIAGRRVYTIGEKFGTIGFKIRVPVNVVDVMAGETELSDTGQFYYGYEYVEVTTFRSEVYTSKSRKPEVKFVPSLDEDLARRDFTFNAMVLRNDGTIYDKFGGKLDIYAKQIKTVGLPKERILEDPLRIFRAARFAARYNFSIDPNFIGKARQLADRIFDVSVERWVQELDKLLTSKYVYYGIEELYKMGLLQRIIPELCGDEEGMEYHINPFGNVRSNTTFTNVDDAWEYLLNGINVSSSVKEPTRTKRYINTGICSRLKFSNQRTDFILDKHRKKD